MMDTSSVGWSVVDSVYWSVGEKVHDWERLMAERMDVCWVDLKVVWRDAWKAVTMGDN